MLGSVGSGSSLYRKFFSKPCDVLRKVRPLAVRLHVKLIFCGLFARGMGIGGAQERLAALGYRGAQLVEAIEPEERYNQKSCIGQ